ncbi:MAG: rhomboid family intramembrane serine protease [Beijerinckiaceae bacterium]
MSEEAKPEVKSNPGSGYPPDLTPPRRREPMFNLPGVVTALIVVFVLIHILREYVLSPGQDSEILRTFAFIPGRIGNAIDPGQIAQELTRYAGNSSAFATARYFLGDRSLQLWSFVTYAFLHGDFVHAGVNSLWLAIFGAPVARRIGAIRFLALFLITAVAGAAAHFALHPYELVPVVGASASVSGTMAAALRFVFQPGGPLGPAVPGWQLPAEFSARLPALPLRNVVRDPRVMQFMAIWFVINMVFGIFSQQLGITSSIVAWEAHVGGFIAGFLLFGLFDPPPPDPQTFLQFRQPVWRG